MPLAQDKLRIGVIEALQTVGKDVDAIAITSTTRPIGDLGFDSIDGLDFSLELEDRLHCKIDEKLNPLVDDERRRARTISEIVEWLATHADTGAREAVHE